jgi:serine/threonine protein kinase
MKAANILLSDSWEAKLTDFGISRLKVGAVQAVTSFSGTVRPLAL